MIQIMKYPFSLGRLFATVSVAHSDNVAIKYLDRSVSYRELDQMSDSLAACLLRRGLAAGDVVGIVNTKEPESLALMVACLKIGVAYTNIDRHNPARRTEAILKQCLPRLVFVDTETTPEIVDVCRHCQIEVLNLKELRPHKIEGEIIAAAESRVTGSRIAYIMFTSGSTGIPKGAVITQQNVLNFIGWSIERFGISKRDVFANISPFYFDNSVFDFYTSLFSGAAIAPIKKDMLSRPLELLDTIDQVGCTIWFSVPSMLIYLSTMKALDKNRFRTIRTVVFGGEGFPRSELHKLYALYKDRIAFVNVYGPTEGTCICSAHDIDDREFHSLEGLPSLGTMNPNFDYVIRDENGHRAERGELCILGPNVGLGYYRDPDKTNEAFLEYSDNGFYKDRMYKTGDLVHEKAGLLYFLGRVDNQIKHMGYRIELEEIELALNALQKVNQAAAIYERVNSAYGKIIAFVASDVPLDGAALREQLKKKLPDYMVPNVISICTSLPKNANGKVDRRKLRDMFLGIDTSSSAA